MRVRHTYTEELERERETTTTKVLLVADLPTFLPFSLRFIPAKRQLKTDERGGRREEFTFLSFLAHTTPLCVYSKQTNDELLNQEALSCGDSIESVNRNNDTVPGRRGNGTTDCRCVFIITVCHH